METQRGEISSFSRDKVDEKVDFHRGTTFKVKK
jgi:hypothetical protein